MVKMNSPTRPRQLEANELTRLKETQHFGHWCQEKVDDHVRCNGLR